MPPLQHAGQGRRSPGAAAALALPQLAGCLPWRASLPAVECARAETLPVLFGSLFSSQRGLLRAAGRFCNIGTRSSPADNLRAFLEGGVQWHLVWAAACLSSTSGAPAIACTCSPSLGRSVAVCRASSQTCSLPRHSDRAVHRQPVGQPRLLQAGVDAHPRRGSAPCDAWRGGACLPAAGCPAQALHLSILKGEATCTLHPTRQGTGPCEGSAAGTKTHSMQGTCRRQPRPSAMPESPVSAARRKLLRVQIC